jgi:hypothetical protein
MKIIIYIAIFLMSVFLILPFVTNDIILRNLYVSISFVIVVSILRILSKNTKVKN